MPTKKAKPAAKKVPAKGKPAAKDVRTAKKASNTQMDAAMRRKLFAEAYLTNSGNVAEAARAAGLSAKTASSAGGRMLKHVEVQHIINTRRAALIEKFELTTERTLREIARLAYADPRKFFNADGTLKQIHELDDDTAATIASVELDEIKEDGVVIGLTRKVKQWDKNAALEKAMKHLGEYEADNRQRNPIHEMPEEALQRFIERKAKEAGVTLH